MRSGDDPNDKSHETQQESTPPATVPAKSGKPFKLDETEENNSNETISKPLQPLPTPTRPIEWVQLVINAVLVVVGIIAVCIYGGQLNVMKGQLGEIIRQYPEINEQAKAATDAVNLARTEAIGNDAAIAKQLVLAAKQAKAAQESVVAIRSQMRQDQRAWLSFNLSTIPNPGIPPAGVPFVVRVVVTNVGKSPAVSERVCLRADILPKDHSPTIPCPNFTDSSGTATIFPGGTTFSDLVISQNFQRSDRDKIMSNTLTLWITGRVEYADVFAVPHWVNFCAHLLNGGGYAICEDEKANEMDSNF